MAISYLVSCCLESGRAVDLAPASSAGLPSPTTPAGCVRFTT